MIKLRSSLFATVAVGTMLLVGQSALFAADKPVADPPSSAFLKTLDPQMLEVVTAILETKQPPLHELTAEQARKEIPAGVAAVLVAKERGNPAKPEVGDLDKIKIPGAVGELDAILYRPAGDKGKGGPTLPALVFFHGGGFVIADAKTYDASARALADTGNCVVISVDYRRAPENKFPAAVEDAYAATQYVITHAAEHNIDPKKVAVGGESAGGNLAAVVCLVAKERKGEMPVAQLLIYPVTDWKSERPSHQEYASSPVLPEANLPWFAGMYFNSPADAKNPLASPIYSENLKGLPPATIINAQCDVLADDGTAYAEKLEAAGVPVKHEVYKGVTHEFFGMGLAVDRAKAAETFAGLELQKAFTGKAVAKE